MDDALRIVLPVYFVVYFGVAFVVKTLVVAKRIGRNPLVLPKDDTAYGLVGRYFKVVLIGVSIYVIAFASSRQSHIYFVPIPYLQLTPVQYLGLSVLVIALVWTVIAQRQMRDSWRIGIDSQSRTELVTTGLFGVSRNSIFLGMILSLVGLFLTTPNAVTTLFLVLGFVLIEVQVRLEEEHLNRAHGNAYRNYLNCVRRYL